MSNMFEPAPEPPTELGNLRILSKTAGIRVSPLVLGGMSIGDAWSEVMGSMDKKHAFQLLDAFYDAGGNFIDTANNYQNEQSETWIGEWMDSRKLRDQMVIATKYTHDYKWFEVGKGKSANFCGNHKRSLHMSVRDSLCKLKTDWIDILYVHWWDYMTSIEEVMDSLHILVQQGKVLYLGVSDTPAWVVSAANYYATSHGKTPFSVYQGKWNILNRDFEREIIPMARHFGMALVPWDVIGGGRFQSKKAIEERKKAGEGLRSFTGASEQTELELLRNMVLNLSLLLLSPMSAPKQKMFSHWLEEEKIEHLKQNIEALSIKLTPEQIKFLESIVPFDVGFPSNFIGEDPAVTKVAPPLTAMSARIVFD
ncbi:AIE_G0043650.mRNA.1.CDS.1 [Saccharomyces cerevisiae]|nr:AIE_G0043650.mRNA.1.CDS.1 [Saccharomyces cerevisiae]CAI6850297.1 AIE_G0043650.mRNA.1.CDS.1 [Saccharomyces cerevisiae]